MQASPFEALFARLAQSDFRSRFRLGPEEVACIERRGMAVIRRHAEDFVRRRLAPAFIPNDGRQTPWRGHPVFGLSMPVLAAVEGVSSSGSRFRRIARCPPRRLNVWRIF